MSQEQDCFSKLNLNSEGFVDGIEDCMYASNQPAIFQIEALLPKIRENFPDAKGITYHERYKISLDGEILEDRAAAEEKFIEPTESELAAMHNLSLERYQTLVKIMNSPMNTLPPEILQELREKKVGSLDGVAEVVTNWLKRQESSDSAAS